MRKPDGAVAELLLERLDELDQRQRVGVEVVDERLALGDRRRLDLEDVGEPVADDLEDLVAPERALFDVGLGRHRRWHATAGLRRAGAELVDEAVLDHLLGHVDGVDHRRRAGRAVGDDAHAVDAEQHRAAVGVGVERARRAASSAGISASACRW